MNDHLHYNAGKIAHFRYLNKVRMLRFVYDYRCDDCNRNFAAVFGEVWPGLSKPGGVVANLATAVIEKHCLDSTG